MKTKEFKDLTYGDVFTFGDSNIWYMKMMYDLKDLYFQTLWSCPMDEKSLEVKSDTVCFLAKKIEHKIIVD